MYLTTAEALQEVKNYIPNSRRLGRGEPVSRILIITDDDSLTKSLLVQYGKGEVTPDIVAQLYGNGRNLRLYYEVAGR